MRSTSTETTAEFDRQLQTLIDDGYAEAAGKTAAHFRSELQRLRGDLPDATARDRLPFVLVVPRLVPPCDAIERVELGDQIGFTTMEPDDLAQFTPIQSIVVPDGWAYLLLDIDLGNETLNVTPDDAMTTIESQGRSPLTLDEGIAVVTQFPEVLKTHNAFSMLGSRCGDRRVTAIWLSTGRPRLGWCWAGNPHTWLGSASCSRRLVY